MVRKLLALMFLVFVVALVLGMRDGKHRNDERMRLSMIHGCVDDAAGKGLPAATSQAFCECTIDRLIKDHGYEKLDKSIAAAPAPQPAWLVHDMRSDAQQCAADMNLEITFNNP